MGRSRRKPVIFLVIRELLVSPHHYQCVFKKRNDSVPLGHNSWGGVTAHFTVKNAEADSLWAGRAAPCSLSPMLSVCVLWSP